jgi:hypothetical protein
MHLKENKAKHPKLTVLTKSAAVSQTDRSITNLGVAVHTKKSMVFLITEE